MLNHPGSTVRRYSVLGRLVDANHCDGKINAAPQRKERTDTSCYYRARVHENNTHSASRFTTPPPIPLLTEFRAPDSLPHPHGKTPRERM